RAAVSVLYLTLIGTMKEIEKDGDSESIYMNIDDIEKKDDDSDSTLLKWSLEKAVVGSSNMLLFLTRSSLLEAVSSEEKARCCSGNPAAVCLGLLCALLLAVTIGLSVKHNGEREQLWSRYINMTMEREQLQTSYINMTMEREQLQTSYINMTMERDQLQSRFDSISKERDQLQGTNNRLQSSHDVLTLERDSLQRQFAEMQVACPSGWTRFMSSCYYVSSYWKTWEQSRQDCRGHGADLVIINSREEQKFVSGLGKSFWIGLTDQTIEGHWKWVDDTLPVTRYVTIMEFLGGDNPRYWLPGEPNNAGYPYRDEDCAMVAPIVGFSDTLSSWNDVKCNSILSWICEKKTRCTAE
ncbi:hypothetical protein NFI96_025756, partial [Prochilodus magdalenae]